MLIDDFMPIFDVSERHHTLVLAPSERAYQAARSVDLARSRVVRALFTVRGIPALVRRSRRSTPESMTLDDLMDGGFLWLGEEAGREFVLGVVGTFWKPSGGVVRMDPSEFGAFDLPGQAKAVWNFRVVPDGGERTLRQHRDAGAGTR